MSGEEMTFLKFKEVATFDSYGQGNLYKIIKFSDMENGFFSCTYTNSMGETETKLVGEQELFQ